MRAINILLAVVAAAVALVIVAAALLVFLVDPNQYKGYVASWVEERTGRSLTIDGDLELAFFPWLAIETEAVTLGHPSGLDADVPFATVERVSAGVKLLPLLERRFEIGRVRIEGLRLNLMRGPDGRGNWESFGTSSASPAPEDEPQADTFLEQLDIERVEIRDAEVRWYEEPSAPRYVLRGIEIETGRIRAGAPVDVSLAVDVEDAETRRRFAVETRANVGLDALGAAAADAVVTLRGFALHLAARDETGAELASGTLDAEAADALADGSVLIASARVDARLAPSDALPAGLDLGVSFGELRFDPRDGTFAVDGLATRLAGITAEWQIDARDVIDAPQLQGELRTANAALAPVLDAFGIALPDGVDANALGRIDASAAFRAALSLADTAADTSAAPVVGPWRIDALALDALAVDLGGTRLDGDASLGDDGVLRVRVDVPEHVPGEGLRALAAAFVPEGIDLTAIDRIGLSGRAEVGLVDGRVAVPELRAALLGAELAAAVEALPAAADASNRILRGTLRTTRIDAARIAPLVGDLMPDTISPAELGMLALDTRFEYDTAAGRLALDDAALEAFGLSATGRVVVTGVGDDVRASGEARVAPFSPRALMTRFGQAVPETSDPSTLQRAALSARFETGPGGARFRDIDLVLDDSRITGEYAIDGVANPAHRFTLAIDRVNVDRYLPPQAGDVPDDARDDTRTAGDIELPADALANLRINGSVEVGDLVLAGLEMRAVSTRIVVGDGRAVLDPARASLYGGEFTGRLAVDTTAQPGLALTGRATSLALAPLITALTGDSNFSGTGDFELELSGTGRTVIENVASANGRVMFSMRDGAIEGFNLGRALCVVYNAARRLPAPAQQPARTEYLLIGGTATVQDGVASSNDLIARASFMDLTGQGRLALAEQRLDYTLEAKLTGSTGIPGCEEMGQLVGESLPLTLRGTVTDPDIRPDFSEIIERRLRDAVRDRLQDRIQDRLRDLLR